MFYSTCNSNLLNYFFKFFLSLFDKVALSLLEVFDDITDGLDLYVENIRNLLVRPFTRDSKFEYSHSHSHA